MKNDIRKVRHTPHLFRRERVLLQTLLVALDHLLDHLTADGTRLAGGQIAVVALLEVDTDLPWCTPDILKSPFVHAFALRKGGRSHAHRNVK